MMEYKGYIGKIEIDDEAGILHGEVLGIRDVVTFQGKTVAAARKAFRESVDDYLAFCADRGEEPNRPMSGQFVVRVDPFLHSRAAAFAEAQGKSLNALVSEALKEKILQGA